MKNKNWILFGISVMGALLVYFTAPKVKLLICLKETGIVPPEYMDQIASLPTVDQLDSLIIWGIAFMIIGMVMVIVPMVIATKNYTPHTFKP